MAIDKSNESTHPQETTSPTTTASRPPRSPSASSRRSPAKKNDSDARAAAKAAAKAAKKERMTAEIFQYHERHNIRNLMRDLFRTATTTTSGDGVDSDNEVEPDALATQSTSSLS